MNNFRYVASASFAVAKHRHAVFFVFALLCAGIANGQSQPVYTDTMQPPWADYSYGGGTDFSSAAYFHGGNVSIAYTPIATNPNYNAVCFALHPVDGDTSTAQYPVLHFWINGGASSGQQLGIRLGLGDDANSETEAPLATGILNTYITGGGIGSNEWREVTVNLTQLNPPYNGAYDRIDIYSLNGTQPTVYIDDVTLTQVAAPPPMNALQVEHNVTVAAMLSDRFTWQDSNGNPRKASLAHNDPAEVGFVAAPGPTYGGAMREFQYQLPNGQTRVANVTTYGNGGYGGFGYVVNHSAAGSCVGDDSPLGDYFPGHWQRVFEGRHHAIFRFTQNYPRNCPNFARTIPVTIDWLFLTGHDNPLYAITYDVDQVKRVSNNAIAPADTLFDDSRAPYGEFNIDGDGGTNIDGVAWGDRFKFTSTSAPVTLNSTWTYNVANTVPYVKEWIAGPLGGGNIKDATMGIVQTQPMTVVGPGPTFTQQDAGGARDPNYHDITLNWGKTSDDGNAGGGYKMPFQDEWAYQANADSIGVNTPNNNARLTWRTQFGFLGQTRYVVHDGVVPDPPPAGPTRGLPGYPKKSYSVYVVLGTHTGLPVEDQVTQVETVQSLTLSTVTGDVVTSGPAGNFRADDVMYQPPGYNHVYGALAFNAATNIVDANVNVGAGMLKKPLIIIGNYTAGYPAVKLDGADLVADADYFASLRPDASQLWITLNRNFTGATNHLQINTAVAGGFGPPTNVVATAVSDTQVNITWTAVAGAISYEIDRSTSWAAGYTQIDTSNTNSYSDINAVVNTAYLYRVRAVNGGGPSGNSAPDLATTATYTNNPIAALMNVTAIDTADNRAAIELVRTLMNEPAYAYTNLAPAGDPIVALDVIQMRAALDEALMALGQPGGGYMNALTAGVSTVQAIDFQELRNRMQ